MLLILTDYLSQYYSAFNVFNYVTLRAIMGSLTALAISLLMGPFMIRKLTDKQIGQTVRTDGPESHLVKAGTPTMGGALILIAIAVSAILWIRIDNRYLWILLLTTLGFGFVGWVDDYKKLIHQNPTGLPARWKYFWQSVVGFAATIILFLTASDIETILIVPFFKSVAIPMGVFYIFFSYLVIVGTSNAVNLTDGLDGLAILPTVLIAGALGIFAYLTGHVKFAEYLSIPYINGVEEVAIYCGAICGAGLGFLWFNTYPAQVFMGDVGALGLGAALGTIAVMVRQEFVLFIMGGVFVMETVSVIIRVVSFKLTGRRVFAMAPLHHHYELKGWPEPRVIVRFWIISFVLVLVGLATLKLR